MRRLATGLALLVVLAPAALAAGDEPLTRAKIEDVIETRIETARLQNRMRANADQYDSVLDAFFRKRARLLRERGWEPEEFDETHEYIYVVKSRMEQAPELRDQKRKDLADLERLRESGQLSEDKVDNMIREVKKDYAEEEAKIERTKPHWPAVRACREELEKLTDWVAGNGEPPPEPDC